MTTYDNTIIGIRSLTEVYKDITFTGPSVPQIASQVFPMLHTLFETLTQINYSRHIGVDERIVLAYEMVMLKTQLKKAFGIIPNEEETREINLDYTQP